jgi:hypothetical protein
MSQVRCECGWTKDYRNPVAAQWGWEAHCNSGECAFQNLSLKIIAGRKEDAHSMTAKVMQGKTEEAIAPILGAQFWTKGTEITGVVTGKFDTANGTAYNIKLDKQIEISGEILKPKQDGNVKLDHMSIGNMKGFEMAIRAAGAEGLERGDKIRLRATGETGTDKGNPMVNFMIRIEREQHETGTDW